VGNPYTAIIKRGGDQWIGWIEEVPGTNCQEATREELRDSMRIVLQEALEFKAQETK
jgi:predicted RNase H-like HicB family nuclease